MEIIFIYLLGSDHFENHPLLDQITNARLGYATINFCNSKLDLGRGPLLYELNPNKDLNKVKEFRILHRTGQLNHFSQNPFHHISLLVKRQAIDVQQLSQNTQAEKYPEVVWNPYVPDMEEQVVILMDGHHRAAMSVSLRNTFITRFANSGNEHWLEQALWALNSSMPDLTYTLPVDIKRNMLKSYGDWHCALYDMGMKQI